LKDTNGYNYQTQNLKDLHKIAAPNLPSSIVHRTHLVRKIQEIIGDQANLPNQSLHRKLLLLCAPAGYGKTTLLADFSLHASMPCCWYFLDETDNDQMIFLQRITRSIRSCFPSFCPSLEGKIEGYISSSIALKENSFVLEELVDLLIESVKIEIPDRFLLFLCNYHEVNANPILQRLMARFLKRLPASCFLVIESRAVPTLEFAPLLWKQEMVGMGMEALKFTSQEIIELASQQNHGVLAEEDAKTLVDLFDGWITGILLGTQLGDQYFLRENSFFLDQGYKVTKPLRQKQLFAYLANEIFQRQPELCSLLEEAAIFQHIIPDVYANLVQINDIEAFLYRVEEKGLFMNHHGEGVNVVFSLHPVLRMYLQDELKQHNPVKYRALHCTSVQLWLARYDYDQAMYHAQIIEDHPLIEQIILQAHEQLLSCGRLEVLIQWVEVLLSISQVCHPKIWLLRAQISLLLGDYVEALLYVEQAQKRFTQFVSEHGEEITSFQEQMNLLQARIFFRAGEYKKTLVICQQFVEKAPSDEEKMLAEAHILLGICTTVMGDFI